MASTIEVSHWPFVIGRGANSDLQLDLPGVWERHIALDQAENGEIRFSCSDQSEVWLNGKAVCHHGRLIPGDRVTVGPLSWRLELAAPQKERQIDGRHGVFADHRCLHQRDMAHLPTPLRVLTFQQPLINVEIF